MPKGRHPSNALSPAKVRAVSEPGRYADGNGLYLVVDPGGAKRWLLRTVIKGRRRDLGLGSLRLVSLGAAREQAAAMRATARKGGDPQQERRAAHIDVPTFREAAETVHKAHSSAWRNPKHAAQWIKTVEQYAYPELAERRVSEIATADILRVLAPVWLTKAETARRLRQRLATIMDWSRAAGFVAGENPVHAVKRGLPKQRVQRGHHAALPYTQVGAFVQRLRECDASEPVRLAFELLIITAARTGELIAARWTEVDLVGRMWTVPAERMKAHREHRVPLSDRAIEILQRAKLLAGDSEFVFPGASVEKPISNMVFLMVLRRMGETATAHGFRSAFRDWAAEKTNFPRDVCEMALAHTIRDKTEAAYRRGDLFAKRQQLMQAWDRFCRPATAAVIQFPSAG
jgi:integrase